MSLTKRLETVEVLAAQREAAARTAASAARLDALEEWIEANWNSGERESWDRYLLHYSDPEHLTGRDVGLSREQVAAIVAEYPAPTDEDLARLEAALDRMPAELLAHLLPATHSERMMTRCPKLQR